MIPDLAQLDRRWYVLATVAVGVFLSAIDSSVVNVALPTLVRGLHTDFPSVQWVVLAYLVTVSALLVGMGRLSDMIGNRRIYATGFVVFTLGSLLCGVAPTIGWLIGFRVLQAVGAAMILAIGSAIVTQAFPAAERGMALGIIGASLSVAIVVGPTLGGLIIHVSSWRWIFYVNLPIGVIGTLLTLSYVQSRRPATGQRFDAPGAATLTAGTLSLLLAMTLGQRIGFNDVQVLGLAAAGLVLLGSFVAIELRVDDPMIDLRLFRSGVLSVGLATGFATFVAISGAILLMPFYLENVLGYEPLQVGLLLAIVPLGVGLMSPLSGALSDRYGPSPMTLAGLVLLLVGYQLLGTLSTDTTATGYVLRFVPIGLGMGLFQSPNNSAIMGEAPAHRLGVVSGLLAITRTLGQTSGAAILGAVWAAATLAAAGGAAIGGAESAPPQAQVIALQKAFDVIAVIVGAALLLNLVRIAVARRSAS